MCVCGPHSGARLLVTAVQCKDKEVVTKATVAADPAGLQFCLFLDFFYSAPSDFGEEEKWQIWED